MLKDLLQPIRGSGNVVRGFFNIFSSPFIFLFNTGRDIALFNNRLNLDKNFQFRSALILNSIKAVGGFLDGISSVIRGITQIISSPFTWFLRMPVRGSLTAIKGMPIVSESLQEKIEMLESLIRKEGKTLEDTICIDRGLSSIALKVLKAFSRGQEIGAEFNNVRNQFRRCEEFTVEHERVDFHGEDKAFSPCDSDIARVRALHFLSLFSKAHTTQESNSEESNTYSAVEP